MHFNVECATLKKHISYRYSEKIQEHLAVEQQKTEQQENQIAVVPGEIAPLEVEEPRVQILKKKISYADYLREKKKEVLEKFAQESVLEGEE